MSRRKLCRWHISRPCPATRTVERYFFTLVNLFNTTTHNTYVASDPPVNASGYQPVQKRNVSFGNWPHRETIAAKTTRNNIVIAYRIVHRRISNVL